MTWPESINTCLSITIACSKLKRFKMRSTTWETMHCYVLRIKLRGCRRTIIRWSSDTTPAIWITKLTTSRRSTSAIRVHSTWKESLPWKIYLNQTSRAAWALTRWILLIQALAMVVLRSRSCRQRWWSSQWISSNWTIRSSNSSCSWMMHTIIPWFWSTRTRPWRRQTSSLKTWIRTHLQSKNAHNVQLRKIVRLAASLKSSQPRKLLATASMKSLMERSQTIRKMVAISQPSKKWLFRRWNRPSFNFGTIEKTRSSSPWTDHRSSHLELWQIISISQ